MLSVGSFSFLTVLLAQIHAVVFLVQASHHFIPCNLFLSVIVTRLLIEVSASNVVSFSTERLEKLPDLKEKLFHSLYPHLTFQD